MADANPTTVRPLDIAVLAGYWSTNVGNAFFQLGGMWALQQARPDANVFLIGDQPGYWNVRRGNPEGALDYAATLEIDALVLLGPIFRPEMRGIIGNLLQKQAARGTKIIILAAGMMAYDEGTVALGRELLKQARPWIMTTRDTETFQRFGDCAEHAFDGVDVASFVSDLFKRVPTTLPPYVVMNFDQVPQPNFTKAGPGQGFEFEGERWNVEQPTWRTNCSHRWKWFPFLDAFLPHAAPPNRFANYDIIRTDHRYNPFLPRKSYRHGPCYVGDIPHSYLSIYSNAKCTFSNRVHACVATAAFGNHTMLFSRSPRAYLLNRLGLQGIKERPVRLDLAKLAAEKQELLGFLRRHLADLTPRSK